MGFIAGIASISAGLMVIGMYFLSLGTESPDSVLFYSVAGFAFMALSILVALAGQIGLFYKLIADAVARGDRI